jgi:hypothetical protein
MGNAWQLAFEFLVSLNLMQKRRNTTQGNDILAMVMSYETRPPV